jgi:hypothetical protein
MTTILVKDALRTSVEAASGGKQTVLYTPKDSRQLWNIIPKVSIESLNPALGFPAYTRPLSRATGKSRTCMSEPIRDAC